MTFAIYRAAVIALLISGLASVRAGNFITKAVQGTGNHWANSIWSNGVDTVTSAPAAGNTYETKTNGVMYGSNTGNTRLRNPASGSGDPVIGVKTFPGDSLTLNAHTDIRSKGANNILDFPGVGGNAGLILNGGALNPGDDGTFSISGKVSVASASLFAMADNGLGAFRQRFWKIAASLTGTAPLILLQAVTNVPAVDVTSTDNTYSGEWIVKSGWLKGSGVNSLGWGDITLNPAYAVGAELVNPATALSNGPVRLEINYDIDTPGTLTVNGDSQLVMHQNLRFARVIVDGVPVPNGTYTYAEAAGAFPTKIVGGGSGTISVGPATPTALAATTCDTHVLVDWDGSMGAEGYLVKRSTTMGGPYTVIAMTGTTTAYTDSDVVSGTTYYYVVSAVNDGGESASSNEASVTPVRPASAVFFDFNTPGQFANNFALSIAGLFPPFTMLQSNVNGAANSGSIDFSVSAGGTDSTAVFTNLSYDFSQNGATLVASAMVRIKAPTANNRVLQIGFLNRPTTLTGERLTAFMSGRVNSTAQPALTYAIQSQSKVNVGTATIDGTQSAGVGLTAGNWYRLTVNFTNIKATVANNYTVAATFQDMGANGQTPGATVLSLAPANVANADIVNDSSVFFGIRGFDSAGANAFDEIAISVMSGASSFACPPSSRTVLQGRSTTFYLFVNGAPPMSYQWLKGGLPIPGATDWQYTIPAVSLGDAGDYAVQLNGSLTSSSGTLTVTPDTTGPVALSTSSLDGYGVGVCFNESVDPASATTLGNYMVGGSSPYAATLRSDGRSVNLLFSTALSGAFSVQVSGVKDLFNNTMTMTTLNGNVQSQMTSEDIGGPLPIGSAYTWADGDYEITAGGADVWGTADQFRFTHQTVMGDFDVKTLVTDHRIAFANGGQIAKAGLLARESLDPGAKNIDVYVMPQFPGLNRYEDGLRSVTSGGTGGWGVNAAGDPINQGNIGANHPNSWLRLRRVENTFAAYTSADGANWNLLAITTQPFAKNLFVGLMMMNSHAQGFPATSKFLDYGDFAGYAGATLAWTMNIDPSATNIQAGETATFTVLAAATGAPDSEILYAWQRSDGMGGWINLSSGYLTGTSNTFVLTTPPLFFADSGAQFRAIAKVTGGATIISDVATVTVEDTAGPTVASAAIPSTATHHILLVFSEPISEMTATNTANYVVTNAAGTDMGVVSAAFLGNDPRTIVLTLANQLVGGNYGVVINFLEDANGNVIAADTIRTFSQATPPAEPVVIEVIGNITGSDATALGNYIASAKFVARTPDFITYSNLFAHRFSLADSGLNNYGARVFSYFIAPSNGLYKFYMRSDDSSRLLMNTNVGDTTLRAGATQLGQLGAFTGNYTLMGQNVSLVGGQAYYLEALMKEGTGGDGVSVAVRAQSDGATPPNTEVISGSMLAYPASEALPTPVITELYTGFGGGNQIADQLASYNNPTFVAGLPNFIVYEPAFGMVRDLANSGIDNYLGRMISYFVAPSNGLYKFYIRSDDSCQFFMNTNAANSTDPAGKVLLGQLPNFVGVNYTLAAQNISLVGGQRYFMEGMWKEGGGGDGMTVAVRAQEDATVPPNTDAIPGSLLEFPTELAHLGLVSLAGITPASPTVAEGQTVSFAPVTLRGGLSGIGFTWFKNGQVVFGSSPFYTTPPLSLADNGAVFTLLVTNAFSRVSQSAMVTVTDDSTGPAIVSAVATPAGNGVSIVYSEPVDSASAAAAGNYSFSGGLMALSASLDLSGRRVTVRTSQQTPGTTYTVTVNGVRDLVGNQIAADSTATFTAWSVGGCGLLVEVFTNITGTLVANLTTAQKFIDNQADLIGYVPSFGFGTAGTIINNFTGLVLDNYGVRVSGLFVAPSNGVYRFYIRSDDGSQLFINSSAVNSTDPAGKVLVADVPAANLGFGDARTVTAGIALNGGQAYYMEALMKEGGGGDYVQVTFREQGDASVPPINTEFASGRLFNTFGNPDTAQLIVAETPPTDVFLTVDQDPIVSLTLVAAIEPPAIRSVSCYQWQRFDSGSMTFVNIPGATGSNYTFTATTDDDEVQYRLVVSLPGAGESTFTTTIHVNESPIAVNDTLGTVKNAAASMPAARLIANDVDPDGDPITLISVSSTSAQGGTVTRSGGTITYTPPADFTGADQFGYAISDGAGGFSVGVVNVTVTAPGTGGNLVAITILENGNVRVDGFGIPGRTYTIERSTDMMTWTALAPTVVAGANGAFTFEDTSPPPDAAFYQATTPLNP